MKKKLLVMFMTTAIAISVVAGFSFASSAGNTTDTEYEFYNSNSTGNTSGRSKTNTTKTYIYPKYGPALNYTVQGSKTGSNWENRSSSHTVYNGTKASFTNFVYENGEAYARLHLEKTTTAYVWSRGVWSPDSTRNYTIYY